MSHSTNIYNVNDKVFVHGIASLSNYSHAGKPSRSKSDFDGGRSISLSPKRLRVELHLRVLAVEGLGATHRLDGPQRDQRPPRFYRTRRNLEKSLQKGF